VASQYSCRPQAGGSDSWNEERRPLARGSQFQPPSGHCQATSECASSSARGSPAIPKRQATASALPSWEAQRRVSPSITCIRWRWDRPVSQSSTVEAAACRRGSPAGAASSTSDTSRQWAPVHLL
jgi:hypothetical protein